VIMFDGPLLYT